MERINSWLISFILPVLAVMVVACGYQSNKPSNYLCDHLYALCTSALCVPQPGDPTKAICFCDVDEGKSMGSISCDQLAPSIDKNGIRTVYSTFSFKQFNEGKKSMKCPKDTPWTWCLNKRCTMDPNNPRKAICVCDVVRDQGEWTTLGGDCNTDTCKTGYWSGATIKAFAEGNAFMMKVLGLSTSPAKWCEATTP